MNDPIIPPLPDDDKSNLEEFYNAIDEPSDDNPDDHLNNNPNDNEEKEDWNDEDVSIHGENDNTSSTSSSVLLNQDTISLTLLLVDGSQVPLLLPLIQRRTNDNDEDVRTMVDVTVWELSRCLVQITGRNHIAGLFRVSDGIFVSLTSILRHPFIFLSPTTNHHNNNNNNNNCNDDDNNNTPDEEQKCLYCISWPPPSSSSSLPVTTTNVPSNMTYMFQFYPLSFFLSKKQTLWTLVIVLFIIIVMLMYFLETMIPVWRVWSEDGWKAMKDHDSYEQFLFQLVVQPVSQTLEWVWYSPWRTMYRYGPSPLGWEGQDMLDICSSMVSSLDVQFWSRNPQECQTLYDSKEDIFLEYYTNPLLYLILLYTIYHFIPTSSSKKSNTTRKIPFLFTHTDNHKTDATSNLHHYLHFPQGYPIPQSQPPIYTPSSSMPYNPQYYSTMNDDMLYPDDYLQHTRFPQRNINTQQQQQQQQQRSQR